MSTAMQMQLVQTSFEIADCRVYEIMKSSGSCQAVVRQSSGSRQAVVRQSSGSRQAVVI